MSNSTTATTTAMRLLNSQAYWKTDAGRALWEVQRACLGPVVDSRAGRHSLEIGMGPALMTMSAIAHPIRWAPSLSLATSPSTLVCPSDHLALPDRCMDVVIIHHWLEHLNDAHHTLQEAARVTADNGMLVLFGFNPLGPKGLTRQWRKHRSEFPWNGQWHKPSRLRDWLAFVDFEVERVDYCCFRGLIKASYKEGWEALGRRHNLPWGESYMIQAQRRQQNAYVKRVRFSLQNPVPSSSLGATRSGNPAQVHAQQEIKPSSVDKG
ncbi:methyltransferase domain-containing protein [Vreelandella populi]|uniref:Methyltransferase domain-containing protein n=1 Tax=Vreelandella populi TaxID=2498858 RepID=A0A3S0WLC1_9GAMM|nr:methyltransferase domain-containing protein [Halomonas populi]RUR38588.1 methyltransferase domain-containing protein [Halomonas populi]RUR43318.1 methyltransferase domain-containing protein [Halomonas populi]RUR51660.1 methyltransferase domain-containing protein [Halomonas populi]